MEDEIKKRLTKGQINAKMYKKYIIICNVKLAGKIYEAYSP